MTLKRDRKRDRRRAAAIHAYVGANGGGKSLAMVHDTLPSVGMTWTCDRIEHRHTRDGITSGTRSILSTVAILDPATGDAHPAYVPLRHWRQLLDVAHADVLLDEVQGVVSSRGHQSLPPAVLNLLLQLRRRDVLLRWTSPAYGRADVVLREVTQAVTYCRGYSTERVAACDPECEVEHEHVGARLWGARKMFRWLTYDALAFDEFTAGKRDQLRAEISSWYSRRRNSDQAQSWYDTLDQVEHIRDADEGGTCLHCGGTRRRPRCECVPSTGTDRKHGAPAVASGHEDATGSTSAPVTRAPAPRTREAVA